MEKLFDLLLENVNDKTKQAAGLVSIMSRDDTRCYIKVRIWDLVEGQYGFHMGDPSVKYKSITQFHYTKPYVNFEFPCEAENVDRVFVTNEDHQVVLISDQTKTDEMKVVLKEYTKEKTPNEQKMDLLNETPVSDGIPQPPKISDYWDFSSEKKSEPEKEEIPKPDELESDMIELPDDLLDFKPEKSIEEPVFDIEKYRDVMESRLEYFEPFDLNREDYVWWKVVNPVVLHEQLLGFGVKIRNFFNATVMMSFFKYGFLLSGIYTHSDGSFLLVFGFPSSLQTEHKPFEDCSVWVRNKKGQGSPEGYWLIYYDPETKSLINW